MVEISDRDSLEAWLDGQPRQVAVAIAARAALRVTPLLQVLFEKSPDRNIRDAIILPTLRCCIASWVAAMHPTPKTRNAAVAAQSGGVPIAANADDFDGKYAKAAAATSKAARAAFVAARTTAAAAADSSRNNAAGAFIRAATARPNMARSMFFAVSDDTGLVPGDGDVSALMAAPLWHAAGMPDELSGEPTGFRAALKADGPRWNFWLRWYDAFLAGHPVNWNIQRDIAFIPDADWKRGPEHIAERIAEIEARYLAAIDQANLSRQVSVLLAHAERSEIISVGLARQIEDAISQYMRDAGTNALPEELGILGQLPQTLRGIGVVVVAESQDNDRIRELEALVTDLAGEIQELKRQLESLSARPVDDVFLRSFKEQAGKSLGDWKIWAAVLGGATYLTGHIGIEESLKGLGTVLKELFPTTGPPPPPPPFTV